MKLTTEPFEFDVVSAFLHDKYDCGPFSQYRIAQMLSELLESKMPPGVEVRVASPDESGLDRFVLFHQGEWYIKRAYDRSDLAIMWPEAAWDALQLIEREVKEEKIPHEE